MDGLWAIRLLGWIGDIYYVSLLYYNKERTLILQMLYLLVGVLTLIYNINYRELSDVVVSGINMMFSVTIFYFYRKKRLW